MPKPSLKNPFTRRKSSGNALDIDGNTTEAPAQSSFRVIERPEKSKIVFDGSDRLSKQVTRPFNSPLQQLRGKSVDDLTYHANGSVDTAASRKAATALNASRGSAGTTHSGSSEFYQSSSASARHSSSSTLPSSVDPDNEAADEDELFTKNKRPAKPQSTEPLPPPPSFSARAQRAFSFGLKSKPPPSPPVTAVPSLPIDPPTPPSHSPTRERALTTSSYASTAVPARTTVRPKIGSGDFGGDFGSMFARPEDTTISSTSTVIAKPTRTVRTGQKQRRRLTADFSKDSEPLFPPRSYSREDLLRQPSESPYSQERRNSRDGLLASSGNSPNIPASSSFFPDTSKGYARVPDVTTPVDESRSGASSVDIDHDGVKRYQLRDSQEDELRPLGKSSTAPALSFTTETATLFTNGTNPWEQESSSATPKANNRISVIEDEPLFDTSPAPRASHAKRPEDSRSVTIAPRRLTKAQFEILQRYSDKTTDSAGDGDGDGDSGNEYEDDDEKERAEKLMRQRRKQEANMAVYRQQMKKVTGGGPTDLPARPNLETRASSTPSIYVGGVLNTPPAENFKAKQSDDEDDDIPLGILQAHGFPSSNRPPTRSADSFRPPSVAGQRSSQALPPFARRLPEDPYFGAGLVNPAARESLAFGSGSVYGGNSTPPTPGGLVGIIANEERQRQARRGSPNPLTGTYNAIPNMPRTTSMASMQAPQFYPPMPGMPMMPAMPMTNDPAMQEFMQMQMQFMQNMQAMMMQQTQMQQGTPGLPSAPINGLGQPGDQARTMSMLAPTGGWNSGTGSRPQSTLDPRMSTVDPRLSTFAPSVNGFAGYTPSIAPSERSNVGQPSRYRPVQTEDGRSNSFTSSITLNAFSKQPASPAERPVSQHQSRSTIRVIDKPKSMPRLNSRPTQDEDEDGDWGDMAKKKRSKRADRMSKSAADRVPLSELYPNVEL